jgi:hypothetical protein
VSKLKVCCVSPIRLLLALTVSTTWQIDGALTPSNISCSNSIASSSVFTIFCRALSLPLV